MHTTYDSQSYNSSIIRHLYATYGVERVVKDYWISPERKAELFLLGATFDAVKFRDGSFNIVIYENQLMILSNESSSFAQLSE